MISPNLISIPGLYWFDVEEPREEDYTSLRDKFSLPGLLVQDTLRPEHLPKYEFSEEGHFFMMRSYDNESDLEATTVQELTRKIALFITENQLITIHRVQLPFLSQVQERCKKNESMKSLPALVHKIVLGVIRTYEEPIESLQNLYDEFETEILSKKLENLDTTRIYHFRRKLFTIKRILKQTNDSLYRSKEFWEDYPSMLQDLKENIEQIYFRLDEISDNFEHLFQLHISLNDQRANEVMKVLTVFSSILLPLNFLASFYGMNFSKLPGLDSWPALIILILIMFFLSVTAIWYFKKKGWFKTTQE